MRDKIISLLEDYDKDNIHIGTIGSHSALNILKGAKEEGFSTICICRERERKVYENFGVADRFLIISDYSELLEEKIQDKLRSLNTILIPHGSFNAYIGRFDSLLLPMFGNRELMIWETDRDKQREWLEKSGVRMPKKFSSPEEIEGLAIVKYPGAKGGKGYFIISSPEEFYEISEEMIRRGLIREEDVKKPRYRSTFWELTSTSHSSTLPFTGE